MPENSNGDLHHKPGSGNSRDLNQLYKTCYPQVSGFILQNSGTAEDVKDIFQDAVMIFHLKSGEKDFQLTSNVCTFLFAIARHLWLKFLRSNRLISIEQQTIEPVVEEDFLGNEVELLRKVLLAKCLAKINERCQEILKRSFEGVPGENIANGLEFESYEYYRVAKTRCLKKLKTYMEEDKLFNELK